MVIAFPQNKKALAKPAVKQEAERRSPSFAYALIVALALSLVLWVGVVALVRL